MELDVQTILFSQANHQVTSDPHVVACLLRSLGENLELPLSLGYFSVNPFEINPCVQSDVDVLFDNLTCNVTYILVANARVIWALRCWVTFRWESERTAIFVEEIFLFKTNPQVIHVLHLSAEVRWVWFTIGEQYVAQNEEAVFASAIWVERNRLEQTIGASPLCLLRRAAVKSPHREIGNARRCLIDHLGLAAHIGLG